jgi:putative peptide zinc metalloprotease protein
MRLRNRDLELELTGAAARAEEVQARLLKAMKEETADLKPLLQTKAAVDANLAKLHDDVASLTVRARHDGIWVAPGMDEYLGRWLPRGTNLGLLVNPTAFEFVATVMQEDADAVFAHSLGGAEVRLVDAASTVLDVPTMRVIPGEQRQLPSPALGLRGGGDVPVEAGDEKGSKTMEPYFKVIARLPANSSIPLFDGVSGRMRFNLGSEPLLSGWMRRLWQLLQKRYQM